jgi:Bacterial EndoU nuclease
MSGKHGAGTGLPGTSEFPASWTPEDVVARIIEVSRDPDAGPVEQPNGKSRSYGVREGVGIVVLAGETGSIITGYPVSGPGVVRNPVGDTLLTVNDLLAGRIGQLVEDMVEAVADRLPADDLRQYRLMYWAGEYAELADVLAAHLVLDRIPLTPAERDDLHTLLVRFERPVPGCDYINNYPEVIPILNVPG